MFSSKANDRSPIILCVEKQTTSTRKAESCEVRRSARLKAISHLEVKSRRKESETGLSSADETLWNQTVGISLVLLLATYRS